MNTERATHAIDNGLVLFIRLMFDMQCNSRCERTEEGHRASWGAACVEGLGAESTLGLLSCDGTEARSSLAQ